MQETLEMQALPQGLKDPLEQEIAPHFSIPAWETPRTGSLAGYSPWDRKESDTAEQPSTHTHTNT